MFSKLKPDLYYKDVFSIDLSLLKSEGIKGLICDIDNTIVSWSEDEVVIEVINWLAEIKNEDFIICLVSNGIDKRVQFFSEELSLPAVGQAIKPAKRAFKVAQKILQLKPDEIAVIGDQIFTDVLGGNRMGYMTILVDPMSEKELITTKFMRSIEKFFFKRSDNHEEY
ncbi:MAG: YqeG family HAD IIIA-type phosphatase [Halanaerobiaceae bacterium]